MIPFASTKVGLLRLKSGEGPLRESNFVGETAGRGVHSSSQAKNSLEDFVPSVRARYTSTVTQQRRLPVVSVDENGASGNKNGGFGARRMSQIYFIQVSPISKSR